MEMGRTVRMVVFFIYDRAVAYHVLQVVIEEWEDGNIEKDRR